jgi:hypothetical protein
MFPVKDWTNHALDCYYPSNTHADHCQGQPSQMIKGKLLDKGVVVLVAVQKVATEKRGPIPKG